VVPGAQKERPLVHLCLDGRVVGIDERIVLGGRSAEQHVLLPNDRGVDAQLLGHLERQGVDLLAHLFVFGWWCHHDFFSAFQIEGAERLWTDPSSLSTVRNKTFTVVFSVADWARSGHRTCGDIPGRG